LPTDKTGATENENIGGWGHKGVLGANANGTRDKRESGFERRTLGPSREVAILGLRGGFARADHAQPGAQRLWLPADQGGVIGGVGQYLLHVVAGLFEGNVLCPD